MHSNTLEHECGFIHRRIFGFEPSKDIQKRYVQVHDVYHRYIKNDEQMQIGHIIQKKVDLVSLEFFWRFKNRQNLLSKKIQILFYLTEVKPEYQRLYISDKNDSLAIVKLAYFTMVSGYRLLKGFLIYLRIK